MTRPPQGLNGERGLNRELLQTEMDVFELQCSSPGFYNRRSLPDINTANPPTFQAPGKEDRSDFGAGSGTPL
jgi:hypothetical protein